MAQGNRADSAPTPMGLEDRPYLVWAAVPSGNKYGNAPKHTDFH